MRNWPYYIIILSTILSCDYPTANFTYDKEFIPLQNFISSKKDYEIIGSYAIDKKPITSQFYIGSGLNIDVFAVGTIKNKINYKVSDDDISLYSHFCGINGDGFELSYYTGGTSNTIIENIDLYNPDGIKTGITNDTIHEYFMPSNDFTISLNGKDDFGISARGKGKVTEIIFYEKHNTVYMLLFTGINETTKFKSSSLLRYLTDGNWQPDLKVSRSPETDAVLKKIQSDAKPHHKKPRPSQSQNSRTN